MINVVGIGADGLAGVSPKIRQLIDEATVLVGSPRHLAMVEARPGQQQVPWPRPLTAGLDALLAQVGTEIVVLASGDPMVSGIGSVLVKKLGLEQVTIHPSPSSVSLARARLGWAAEGLRVVTTVGRDLGRVRAELGNGERLIVLSEDETTPAALAELLVQAGYPDSVMTVLSNLGAENEESVSGVARTWQATVGRLNVVAVECRSDVQQRPAGVGVALSDRDFDNDGQLTKLPLRLLAIAHLRPAAHQVLWDVGAGAGSISIEWTRSNPLARTIGIERNPQRAQRARDNAATHGVAERVEILEGDAEEVLRQLAATQRPDAVFFGGGASEEAVRTTLELLPLGGRLVVHSVTLETDALLDRLQAELGGQLIRLSVEQAQPLGRYRSWKPARTVTCWAYIRENLT